MNKDLGNENGNENENWNENENEETSKIINKLKKFISELNEYADDYNLSHNDINDIYEILQSEILQIEIFESESNDNLNLFDLIKYHHEFFNKIIQTTTYEDICQIIIKYILESNEQNIQSLGYEITQNLIKINLNQIKKVIYKTSPRLLTKSEQVLIDIIFEEEVSNNYLIKTIKWLKNNKSSNN